MKVGKTIQISAILTALFLHSSCTLGPDIKPSISSHFYPVDSDSTFYPYPETKASLKDIPKSEEALHERIQQLNQEYASNTKIKEILIFIHGGLITEKKGLDAALAQFKRLKHDDSILPIFVTWDSGLLSSYWRHLSTEGSGIAYYDNKVTQWPRRLGSTLLNLPTDIGVGIVETPRNMVNGLSKTAQTTDWAYRLSPSTFATRKAYEDTLRDSFGISVDAITEEQAFYKPSGKNNIPWSMSLGKGQVVADFPAGAASIAFLPVSTALAPLYSGVGKPAWDNMNRRAKTLVHRYPTMIGSQSSNNSRGDGVFAAVLGKVAAWQRSRPSLKVTLVGHSMGAIVLNEAIRGMDETPTGNGSSPTGAIPFINIDRLIYLAAACSIRDFVDTGGRYLMRNSSTKCYNLCLHPSREFREQFLSSYVPLVYSGSLLMWIDEFFERPRDFKERTFGSFENCITAYRHMPSTSRFHLKAFADRARHNGEPADSQSGPQKHGQFDQFEFWKDEFLEPCMEGPNYFKD